MYLVVLYVMINRTPDVIRTRMIQLAFHLVRSERAYGGNMKNTCTLCSVLIPKRNKYCEPCRAHFLKEFNEERRRNATRQCAHCGADTMNPQYCSSSCAATVNDEKYPKRFPEGECLGCRVAISKARSYCNECLKIYRPRKDWSIVTLGEL